MGLFKKKEGPRTKASIIQSIFTKITLLVVVVTVIATGTGVMNANSRARSAVEETNEHYIMSLAEQAAVALDATNSSDYAVILSGVEMKGISSSYAYLVSEDGTMLYHPTAEKIGAPVENSVVKGLIAQLQAGQRPKGEVVEYEFKGAIKYAGYELTSDNMIVVVTADKTEIVTPVNDMVSGMVRSAVISAVICIVIGLFLSFLICRPIKKVSGIVRQTAEMDFTYNEVSAKMAKRKDETGIMAQEVMLMRSNLREIVGAINDTGREIHQNVSELSTASAAISGMCSANSATTEQIAAGMDEAASSTTNISDNVQSAKDRAVEIAGMAERGSEASQEVMERAKGLGEKTQQASARTMTIYQDVHSKAEQAMESSKAVAQIANLTEAIHKIASQTTLLALNASIEAARAGAAGKGFGVVANEIKDLASQTTKTIADIEEIVKSVNEAVQSMTECISQTSDFLEQAVLKDYEEFDAISQQYQSDADLFLNSMGSIHDSIMTLTDLVESSAAALEGVKVTVNESAVGTSDIANKTINMSQQVEVNNAAVSNCVECIERLKELVSRFKLDD